MQVTGLAERSKITRSRLSHAVARLNRNGWLPREGCPSDGRGQIAVLTDAGYEELVRTAPGYVAAVRAAVFDRPAPEQSARLGGISGIIADGLLHHEGADVPWLH